MTVPEFIVFSSDLISLSIAFVQYTERSRTFPAEYQKRYEGLTKRFEAAKARMETVTCAIKEKVTRCKTIGTFLADLKKQEGLIDDFDPLLWHNLVDFVTVYSPDDVRFTFKNGYRYTGITHICKKGSPSIDYSTSRVQ